MSELTIHTGGVDSLTTIHVAWFNHNNVRQMTDVEIRIQPQDKPRTLEVRVNGVVLAVVPPKEG
jgi:hypothetical protein